MLEASYGDSVDTVEFMVLGEWSPASFGNLTDTTINGFEEAARYGIIGGTLDSIWGYGEDGTVLLDIVADTDGAVLLEMPDGLGRFLGGSDLGFVAYGDGEPLGITTLYSDGGVGVVVDFGAGTQSIAILGAWEQ